MSLRGSTYAVPDRRYRGALDWVNDVRVRLGRERLAELPKGKRHDTLSCPLANALRDTFDPITEEKREQAFGRTVRWDYNDGPLHTSAQGFIGDQPITFEAPAVVGEFMLAFDAGEYPMLERRRWWQIWRRP